MTCAYTDLEEIEDDQHGTALKCRICGKVYVEEQ